MRIASDDKRFSSGGRLPAATTLALLFVLASFAPAAGQESSGNSFAVTTALSQGWSDALTYVQSQQRAFTNELAAAVRTLRAENSLAAAWGLIVVSFLYGVFHAAGPGHGKAVIATYLLTHPSDLRRGLGLAWLSSLVQGLTAIVLVLGLVHIVGFAMRETRDAVGPLESASFALVALLGAWLVVRAILSIRRSMQPAGNVEFASHSHTDAACCSSHGPNEEQLRGVKSWRNAVPIVASIGIRPCSGAVLVLLIAEAMGLRMAGIGAVFAIAIGTASTVSVLAASTLYFRKAAQMLVRSDGRIVQTAGQVVALAGGGLIMALGTTLFLGSLGSGAATVF